MSKEEEKSKLLQDWFNETTEEVREEFVKGQDLNPALYELKIVKKDDIKIGDYYPGYMKGAKNILWGELIFSRIEEVLKDTLRVRFEFDGEPKEAKIERSDLDEQLIIRVREGKEEEAEEEAATIQREKDFRAMSMSEKEEMMRQFGFNSMLFELKFIKREELKLGDYFPFFPPGPEHPEKPYQGLLGFGKVVNILDDKVFITHEDIHKIIPDAVQLRINRGSSTSHLIIRVRGSEEVKNFS